MVDETSFPSEETGAEKVETEVATQKEENEIIGVDTASPEGDEQLNVEVETGQYRITGDVVLFGETVEPGSVVTIAKALGENLVVDGVAEVVEA